MVYKGTTNRKEGYYNLIERIASGEWPLYLFLHSIYVNTHRKIIVTCKEHGDFSIAPSKLKMGKGCTKCVKCYSRTQEEYERDVLIWTDGGIKCLGKFKGMNKNTEHEGTKCGFVWSPRPGNIYTKSRCPICVDRKRGGFHSEDPAILYYLSINNGEAYKIGITNRSVEARYTLEEQSIFNIVQTWRFDIGRDAYIKEQKILKDFKEFKYVGKSLLKTGNTELFYKDVLMLEYMKGH